MKKILVVVLALAAISAVNAATVVGYEFTGAAGTQVSTVGASDFAEVTPDVITRGPGLGTNAGTNSLNSNGWSADATQDYVTFGFTVQPSYQADLTNFIFSGKASSTGPAHFALRSSLDNYVSDIVTWDHADTNYANLSLDISSLGTVTNGIQFRIVLRDNVAVNGGTISATGTWRIGDYYDGSTYTPARVEGTVTPEPTGLLLLGLGLLIRRR